MDLRGTVELHRSGRLAEAESAYRRLIAADPSDANACHLLGLLLQQQGRLNEAIELLRRAVTLAPRVTDVARNLGLALGAAGRHAEAADRFAEALRLAPDHPQTLYNFAVACERLGRLDRAIDAYRRAVALEDDYADAHHGLGNALRRAGRLDESIAAQARAISLRPDSANAYVSLGGAYTDLGLQAEAIESYRKVVDLRPASARDHSVLLYALHYEADWSPARIAEEHRRWAQRHAAPLRPPTERRGVDRDPNRKLRVGYVSPDFRRHAICRFVEPLLAHHDRERFEIFCYADLRKPDETTRRIQALAHHWRDWTGRSDEQAAQSVRDDGIDILVDLAGHGAGNRLLVFARKPALIQVAMIGYPDTTGMDAIDYRITDADQDPPGPADALYAERLIRLPRSAWCYRPDADTPPVSPLPASSNGFATFGCLNKRVKVTPAALELWAQILRRVPGSRLLLSLAGGDAANPSARARIERCGIPGNRLVLLEKAAGPTQYLERYAQIDIALDAFPYNGATTTCDALWMGVPVIALAGGATVSRAAASLLRAAGLSELACNTDGEYVDRAVQLARDPARLAPLRSELRERLTRSSLRDEPAFARAVEAAYQRMCVNG